MLIFPLKKEWYDKIKSGEKTVEYREVKPYWENRIQKEIRKYTSEFFLCKIGDWVQFHGIVFKCKLRLGYSSAYLGARILMIKVVDGKDTDLHIDKPVYAILLADVKENK